MGAPFGVNQGVQLVYNNRFRRCEHVLSGLAGKHQVQGFRRDNQDVRRAFYHFLPVRLRRVACSDSYRNLFPGVNSLQRPPEILTDIGCQGFQRRDIDYI